MTVAIEKKGQLEIELSGKKTILHSTFENLALFEQVNSIGLPALILRIRMLDIRMTDVVNVLWAFSVDRDKDGWKKEDVFQACLQTPEIELHNILIRFINVMYGDAPEPTDDADTDEDTKKK